MGGESVRMANYVMKGVFVCVLDNAVCFFAMPCNDEKTRYLIFAG